ncbi:unnamed protein product [Mortierella alpina]
MKVLTMDKTAKAAIASYQNHYRQRKKYWDGIAEKDNAIPDYTVDSARMFQYFNDYLFTKAVHKSINPNVGYQGAVLLAPEVQALAESGWSDEELDDVADDEQGDAEDGEVLFESDLLAAPGWQPHTPPAGTTEADYDIAEAWTLPPPKPIQAQVQALPSSPLVERGSRVVVDAEEGLNNRKEFDVPAAIWTVKSCRTALHYLWREQSSRTARYPNPASHPKDDLLLRDAIKNYEARLVLTNTTMGQVRTTSCAVRDPYTARQFLHMIAFTWRMIPIPQKPSKRKYETERFPHIREHLNLLARHHMLLRDEDIRNLALSDVFSTLARHTAPGSREALGLIFSLRKGKTNQTGDNMYATAFRHKNYLRCTVAAFAFYMFERFQVEQELLPDFANYNAWYGIRVLTTGTPMNRLISRRVTGRTKNDVSYQISRTVPISNQTQNRTTSSVMTPCHVYSPRVTHMGRHSGAAEAYHLGLSIDHLRLLGRWSMGQMEKYYMPKNPTIGAFYMAHFYQPNDPYFLPRDLVTPPLSLQRRIFPWIEQSFEKDSPERTESWIKECDKDMLAIDPGEPTDHDFHLDFNPAKEKDMRMKSDGKRLINTAMVDRMAFLSTLVRMRRVILQDAVLYLKPDASGRTLSNTLFTSDSVRKIFFEDVEFLEFQADLLRAMDEYARKPELVNPAFRLRSDEFIQALNSGYSRTSRQNEETHHGIATLKDEMSAMGGQLRTVAGQLSDLADLILNKASDDAKRLTLTEIQRQRHQHLQEASRSQQEVKRSQQEADRLRQAEIQLLGQLQPQSPQERQSQQRSPPQQPTSESPQLPPRQSHLQQHQPGQLPMSLEERDQQGYRMLPDDGRLTIRQAWDEFHGPVAEAIKHDRKWPYSDKRKKSYRRRREFIRLLQMEADENGIDITVFVNQLSIEKKGRSINSVLIDMKKAKGKAADIDNVHSESNIMSEK